MHKLNELSLVKMAPDSLSSDEEIKRILTVIDIAINKRLVDKIKEVDLDRIDDLEEWKIDHLAVENHIDFYDDKLTLPEKRELVKYSIINHMQKGTAYAVEKVCNIIFGNAEVKEWYEYEGNPYYFRVSTAGDLKDTEDYERVLRVINSYKNTRSWLDSLIFKREDESNLHFGHVSKRKNVYILNSAIINIPDEAIENNVGMVTQELRKIKLK